MIDTCVFVTGVQIAAALLGIAAAILWLGASLTKTPERIPGSLRGSLLDVFDDIHVSLAKQSRRNAQAAACAAGAAILQTGLIWVVPECVMMRWLFS